MSPTLNIRFSGNIRDRCKFFNLEACTYAPHAPLSNGSQTQFAVITGQDIYQFLSADETQICEQVLKYAVLVTSNEASALRHGVQVCTFGCFG